MKTKKLIPLLVMMMFTLTACSNISFSTSDYEANSPSNSNNPLKTKKDQRIESILTKGTWKYQRQSDDCSDTTWTQEFRENRYYKSGGSACLLKGAFSVDAESWHVKDQHLYIVNLSPNDADDIILKYGIDFLDDKKMILSSKGFKYTFLK